MVKKIKYQHKDYILYMLLALVFLAPFFRGLFFDKELAIAHMYTAVVAAIYFWSNRNQVLFSKNITDYAGIGLILAYAISFFVAWNARDAIGEVLKVLNYFIVFWLAAKSANNFENRLRVMWVLYLSGLVVSVIGIGSAFGTFTYNGAYSEGLISSTLQYHNAGAIYMIASGIIGLYLLITVESPVVKMALAAGNYVIFITAMGAGSRGAILVAPIALFIQFIGLHKRDKMKFCLSFLAVVLSFLATVKWVLAFSELEASALWGMLLLGMIVAAGTQYFLGRINLEEIHFKKTWAAAGVLAIMVVLGGLFIFKGTEVLPERITSRIQNISLKSYNIQERTFFYKDAVNMIGDNPVFGYGGGGWNAAFRTYQSYFYNSSEVHSHPLQVWIEAGVLGFLSYAALWLGVILSMVKIMRKRRDSQYSADLTLSWTAFAAATALGLHSLIDFTLSLGALMIFLWALFGVIRSTDEELSVPKNYYFKPEFSYKYRLILGSLLVFLFFVTSASFWLGDQVADQAFKDFEQGNIDEGINKIEIATTLDPFNGDLFIDKAAVYAQLLPMNPQYQFQYQASMLQSANISLKRKKGDFKNQMMYARILLVVNDMDRAVYMAEKAVATTPLMPSAYEELVNVYADAAQKYLRVSDSVRAKEVVNKAMKIPGRMTALWDGLSPEEKKMFQGDPLNKISDNLQKKLYAVNRLVK